MDQTSSVRYLKLVAAVAATLVLAAGAVNWVADPLGVYDTPRISRLNARKPYLDHNRELSRFTLAKHHCKAVGTEHLAGIFGNSRAEIGLDPTDPAFAAAGLQAFNHAIPGTRLTSPARRLRWLEQAGCLPRRALVGVDFFDFMGGLPGAPEDFLVPAPQLDPAFFATTTFSLAGVRDAVSTFKLQRDANGPELTALGFNPLREYHAEVAASGHYRLFRQRAEQSYAIWVARANRLQTTDKKPSVDQLALEDLLSTAARNDVPVDLIIYPYHAELRFMAYQLGRQPLYEQWLRQIVATTTRVNAAYATRTATAVASGKTRGLPARTPLVRLWNFGSITPETLEPIPAAGDRKTQLQRYWEAGHFKPAMGSVLLRQVLSGSTGSAANAGHELFGVEVTPENAEAVVAADRAALEAAWRNETALRREVASLANGEKR